MAKVTEPTLDFVSVRKRLNCAFVPHDRVPADIGGPSMTRQEFADECDVNLIMAKYEKFGVWPNTDRQAEPKYVDFSEMPDFHGCMNMLVEAEAAFMSLPATVRRDFGNDAAAFVEFAQKPENLDKMREYGLAPPPAPEPEPQRVSVVSPPEPRPSQTGGAGDAGES